MITLLLRDKDGKLWSKKLDQISAPLIYVPEDGPLKDRKFERVGKSFRSHGSAFRRAANYDEFTPEDEARWARYAAATKGRHTAV